MWWTSAGERVLTGAEWDIFREGLSTLWDEVEMSEDEDPTGTTGIPVFDGLSKAERLALLALVAKGLCDETEPCPDPDGPHRGDRCRRLRPPLVPDRSRNGAHRGLGRRFPS